MVKCNLDPFGSCKKIRKKGAIDQEVEANAACGARLNVSLGDG